MGISVRDSRAESATGCFVELGGRQRLMVDRWSLTAGRQSVANGRRSLTLPHALLHGLLHGPLHGSFHAYFTPLSRLFHTSLHASFTPSGLPATASTPATA